FAGSSGAKGSYAAGTRGIAAIANIGRGRDGAGRCSRGGSHGARASGRASEVRVGMVGRGLIVGLVLVSAAAFAQEKRPELDVEHYVINVEINPRTQAL